MRAGGGTGHDHAVADVDTEVLAGLRRRGGPRWELVLALLWVALAAAHLLAGDLLLGIVTAAAALAWLVGWWASPQPRVWAVTDDALVVRQGWRTRSLPRGQLRDVRSFSARSYGLELIVQDADPVRLAGTALRPSAVDAQVGALRRWAGLP